jgi:hypothetical protein
LIEKRNITNERKALDDAIGKLETDGLKRPSLFLSGTSEPDIGDISVYGVLRSIQGLPTHDEFVVKRNQTHAGSELPVWYNRMTEKLKQPK